MSVPTSRQDVPIDSVSVELCNKSGYARLTLSLALILALSSGPMVNAMRRVDVDFEYVSEQAAELAEKRFRSQRPMPQVLRDLSYDEYQQISYNNNEYLWLQEGLPFAVGFFHPGYLFEDRVDVREFTATHEQRIPYQSKLFEFGDEKLVRSLPSSLDFSGFRISTDLAEDTHYTEVVSFLGASYFRAVGFGHTYGASTRGLAVNSGLSLEEEFPRFTRVWLGKPLGNDRSLTIYALMNSPSLTGAYQFVLKPGRVTVIDVKMRIFLRESVQSFGVAPITSMFWRGENRMSPETDYRPEVHDSDGLIIRERDTNPIWRPLDLDDRTRLSYFSVDAFDGFGLMQRDRLFDHYQDMEADYHRRPSIWIDAKGDWGRGFVKLVELPTDGEFDDNIIAFFEPAVLPEKGEIVNYEYSIQWSGHGEPLGYVAETVTSTRLGEDQSYPGTHLFVVEFEAGKEPADGEEPPEAVTSIGGPSVIRDTQVRWNPYSRSWRVTLRVDSVDKDDAAVELRCQLKFADESASEIWSYQWTR